MVTIIVKCRFCRSENLQKYGISPNGKQKYKCKDCGRASRESPETAGYDEDFKELVLRACQERMSLRGAERTFGVARQTIARWMEEKKTKASKS